MKRRPLRRIRRRIASALAFRLAGAASRGGAERLRRIGRGIGTLHYWLAWPFHGRLRRDIGRALDIDRRAAATVLRTACRENDRAVFEIIALAHPRCDVGTLVAPVVIESVDVLDDVVRRERGAILLGMHMGNGILMAARLAQRGYPVHVVYRDPRRLPPGLLGRSLERAGCIPIEIDRANPTRSFRRMLQALGRGGLVYVLMDQANKGDGAEREFLGKPVRMPTGVPSLAVRTGAPVVPIHVEAAEPQWRFRVHRPLAGEDADALLDAMIDSMEARIRALPGFWAWHHRRWKRYHFGS
ncbi:MAG: lysophospholipid acyltransferase family protein [Candidatus Wenzhouxiangella sp. M2_3B_020]